jgi:CBS domain-containing protein
MRIADVMTRDLPIVGPGDSLRDAAGHMAQRRVKALPVCDGGRLVGIVTDWDVACAVAEDGDPGGRMVRDFMSTDLVLARPDMTLSDAAEMMADRRVHHLLVSDGEHWEGMLHLDVEWSALADGMGAPIATFTAPI